VSKLKANVIHANYLKNLIKIWAAIAAAKSRTDFSDDNGGYSSYLTYLQMMFIIAAQILHQLAWSHLITVRTGVPSRYCLGFVV
jgi:hypothetical protein